MSNLKNKPSIYSCPPSEAGFGRTKNRHTRIKYRICRFGGAGGSRTLVRRWSGHAFFMLSDALIVGEDQAASLAKSTRIPLITHTRQRRPGIRLFQTMPLMQARLSYHLRDNGICVIFLIRQP